MPDIKLAADELVVVEAEDVAADEEEVAPPAAGEVVVEDGRLIVIFKSLELLPLDLTVYLSFSIFFNELWFAFDGSPDELSPEVALEVEVGAAVKPPPACNRASTAFRDEVFFAPTPAPPILGVVVGLFVPLLAVVVTEAPGIPVFRVPLDET